MNKVSIHQDHSFFYPFFSAACFKAVWRLHCRNIWHFRHFHSLPCKFPSTWSFLVSFWIKLLNLWPFFSCFHGWTSFFQTYNCDRALLKLNSQHGKHSYRKMLIPEASEGPRSTDVHIRLWFVGVPAASNRTVHECLLLLSAGNGFSTCFTVWCFRSGKFIWPVKTGWISELNLWSSVFWGVFLQKKNTDFLCSSSQYCNRKLPLWCRTFFLFRKHRISGDCSFRTAGVMCCFKT